MDNFTPKPLEPVEQKEPMPEPEPMSELDMEEKKPFVLHTPMLPPEGLIKFNVKDMNFEVDDEDDDEDDDKKQNGGESPRGDTKTVVLTSFF